MNLRSTACLLLASALLAGCSHNRQFRVAYVGSEGSAEIAGDGSSTGTPAGAPLVVASGNSLLGPASRLVNDRTHAGAVRGTVSSVLPGSNQTLVQLVNGASIVLNGVGGTLGDVVSVDLGAGKVIGGPTSLVGVSVSARSGSPAGLPAGGGGGTLLGGKLLSSPQTGTRAVTGIATPGRSTTNSVTSTLKGALGGGCC